MSTTSTTKLDAERKRLLEHSLKQENWRHWGPYVSDRSWGTVREDYRGTRDHWHGFPRSDAHQRAYRWGEDAIGGICDRNQYLCFAFSFWNGKDPVLKERLFGVGGDEGNHSEDVKEFYFYEDNTPTHSYMRMSYLYPISAYPYDELLQSSLSRKRGEPEFELSDTDVMSQGFFDCSIEYAKNSPNSILIQLSVTNRAEQAAQLTVVPTLWFRNTWSWGYPSGPMNDVSRRPSLSPGASKLQIVADHEILGTYTLSISNKVRASPPDALFTENETKGIATDGYSKDAFHRYIVENETSAVNANQHGTKSCFVQQLALSAGETKTIQLILTKSSEPLNFDEFDSIFSQRRKEADQFFEQFGISNEELASINRQALAGLLWSKQFYYFDIEQWRNGDPNYPAPAFRERSNHGWEHLVAFDVLSMPDKWEFPYFASWDTAFQSLAISTVDPEFAKRQLELLAREWYMHPNGQIPGYEGNLGAVNPPVHAWAALRIFKIDAKETGNKDYDFLEKIFQKLLLNFTWWINRTDAQGNNVFQGGFLGLDNIGVFPRGKRLPGIGRIDQADGTAWITFSCLSMLRIALELSLVRPIYQDLASKFIEHFFRLAAAVTNVGGSGEALWSEEDGFFHDVVHFENGDSMPLKSRSLVGVIPLLAVDTIEPEMLEALPIFTRRLNWFLANRPHLAGNIAPVELPGAKQRRLVSLVTEERLRRVLARLLDPTEFLSPFGIRSLSRVHEREPFVVEHLGKTYEVAYEPGESSGEEFGGNSNWRGPIWFPLNYLIIESLQKYHHYYGSRLTVPAFGNETNSSTENWTLDRVATELSLRLIALFQRTESGRPPSHRSISRSSTPIAINDRLMFHEFFHPETGTGYGASHQTGWTALVAKLIQQVEGARSFN